MKRKIFFEIINQVEEDDSVDTFFKSMASTVKTFSTSLKIKAKKEIFNIVNNLEFGNHGINNDSTPRIYSSSSSTQSSRENCLQYGEDYDE